MEGPTGFRSLLAPWVNEKRCEIVEDEIRFPNGSRIYLCHCKDEADVYKYLTAEIHVLIIDELTQFMDQMYRFLRARVRMPKAMQIILPEQYRNCFPRILCSSNPGGLGHQFVKMTWVDAVEPMEIRTMPAEEGGFKRQYIPARLSDNPSLDYDSYKNNLSGLGNPELVRAMLDGDWDVVAGAALYVNRDIHMLRPFTPPKHWTRFMSMDWGYVKPYSVGWYCVAEGSTLLEGKNDYPDRYIPDGAIVRYRELYGWSGKANEGCREESEIVVKKILESEKESNERMDYRIADTQMWAKNDGLSPSEKMIERSRELVQERKALQEFNPRMSEKDRQANYQEVCARLRGDENENGVFIPMFYVTANCTNWWRTVPSLVLDEHQPEKGPDEKQELHAYDDTQYGLQSRPFISTLRTRIKQSDSRVMTMRQQHGLDGGSDPYRTKNSKKVMR